MLHTTGPRPGISYSEAWAALDAADIDAIVVDGPDRKLRVGELQVQLHRGQVSPNLVGALLAAAGFDLPAVCRCSHRATDHPAPVGRCVRPGCGCTRVRDL